MLIRLVILPILVLSVLSVFSAEVTEKKTSAELLLEALGKTIEFQTLIKNMLIIIIAGEDNNEVNSQLGQLFYNFVASKEKTSVTAGQFFSTFLQSLTKEPTNQ